MRHIKQINKKADIPIDLNSFKAVGYYPSTSKESNLPPFTPVGLYRVVVADGKVAFMCEELYNEFTQLG